MNATGSQRSYTATVAVIGALIGNEISAAC